MNTKQMRISSIGNEALSRYDKGDRYFLINDDDTSRSFIIVLAWNKRHEDIKKVLRSNWVHPGLARYAQSVLDHAEPGWRMKRERLDSNSFLTIPPAPEKRMD